MDEIVFSSKDIIYAKELMFWKLMLVKLKVVSGIEKYLGYLTNMLVRIENENQTPPKNGLTPTMLAIL